MNVVDTLATALRVDHAVPLLGELFGVDQGEQGDVTAPSTDAAGIAAIAAAHIVAVVSPVGQPVAVALVRVSSGVVVAFDLEDDRRIVVKVHRSHTGPRLAEVLSAQRTLAAAGLPVARALVADPQVVGGGWATVETWHDDGDTLDVRPPALRLAVATAMHDIIGSLDAAGLPGLRPAWTGPYPPPHSPMYDFVKTSSGAEWIDARNVASLAEKARLTAAGVGRLVVGHSDLRPENLLVRTEPRPTVSAIYDLDSLTTDAEPWLVGGVARAFSTNWSTADPMLPTAEEILAFIADYERARGNPFTDGESALARAGVKNALAYSARCEHALFPDGSEAPWGPGWRDLLRRWPTEK